MLMTYILLLLVYLHRVMPFTASLYMLHNCQSRHLRPNFVNSLFSLTEKVNVAQDQCTLTSQQLIPSLKCYFYLCHNFCINFVVNYKKG